MTDLGYSNKFLERLRTMSPAEITVAELTAATIALDEAIKTADPELRRYRTIEKLGKAGLLLEGDSLEQDSQVLIIRGFKRVRSLTEHIGDVNGVRLSRESHEEDGQLVLGYDGQPHAGVDVDALASGTADISPQPLPETGYSDVLIPGATVATRD